MTYNRGKGKGIAFILAHVDHIGDECLIWPFGRDRQGYPIFGHLGELAKGGFRPGDPRNPFAGPERRARGAAPR